MHDRHRPNYYILLLYIMCGSAYVDYILCKLICIDNQSNLRRCIVIILCNRNLLPNFINRYDFYYQLFFIFK